ALSPPFLPPLPTRRSSDLRWFRAPWGNTDRYTRERLRRVGIATVRWSVHGRDWFLREPGDIAAKVLEAFEPGAIVLLHDAIADYQPTRARHGGERGNQEPT